MRRRFLGSILTLLCVTYLTSGVAFSATKTLSLRSLQGESTIAVDEGQTIKVAVIVDNASQVAGASFTIAYDTANLSLISVASTFFGTFVNQNIPTPSDQGYIIIDGVKYTKPLAINKNVSDLSGSIPTGSMLAAARVDNGSGTNSRLFTLNFALTGRLGRYPIAIRKSRISNTDAGYDAGGEAIPFLVGIGSGETYITHTIAALSNATIVVSIVDTDGDEISDLWETDNAPAGSDLLGVFSKTSDYDKDGYSDYVEYMNRFILDPLENPFNPTVKNAPDGEGYVKPVDDAAAILPAMLFMLDMNKTNQ